MNVEQILSRYKAAKGIADQWFDILNDAYEFAVPQRNTRNTQTAGARKGTRVYDSTTEAAVMAFANRLHSDLMPPFQRWASLSPGPLLPEEKEEEARKVLDEATETAFAVINQSNFDSAINEFFIDLAAGTGCLLIQPGGKRMPISYVCVPVEQLSISEDANGMIDATYRTHEVKVRDIKSAWKDATIPTEFNKLITDMATEHKVKLIECTYYDEESDSWKYNVIDDKSKTIMVERASKENPFVVARWMKTPGEVFGRGPIIFNLNNIKTVNKLSELELKNASLAVTGAYMVANDAGVNPNTLRIVPGAFIRVSRTAGPNGPTIAPLPRAGDFNVSEVIRERLVSSIKKSLFDEGLPPQTGAVRSATEIMERIKELSQMTTGPFGRLMSELVNPFMRRTMEILNDLGYIEEHIPVDGLFVQASVISPLAKQQSMDDVNTVVQMMELLNQLAGPEIAMLGIKLEDLPEFISEKLGVSSEILRTKEERGQMQQGMAQQVQAEQQAMMQQQGGASQ